jgi:GNAT superfamily N-acetyltransferase
MTRDEVREIARIVGGDKTYQHFFRRINKEFEMADEDRNNNVYTLYAEDGDEKIGFSVIGHSPAKMKVWNDIFREEGWVDDKFTMEPSPFELMYMYIRPEHRHKGNGKKLFDRTMAFTKNKGIGEVYAYVGDRETTALDFYKRMNAQVIQDFSDEELCAAFLRWQL